MDVRKSISRLFIAIPIISLAWMSISWLSYGIDLPYWDDWRGYIGHDIDSLDIGNLFIPANDTLYPVGKLLDALAYRSLNGNSVAYQFISMIAILTSILYLSWILIERCEEPAITKAIAFSLLVFILQPGSYWGQQSIAYHQAIPLVCVLSIICVATSDWHKVIAFSAVFILTLIAGLSYISGAFSVLSLSIILMTFAFLTKRTNSNVAAAGISSFIGSIMTSIMQAWVILYHQGGGIHDPNASWSTPLEANFWAYALGKFGRILMTQHLGASFGLGAAAILLLVITFLCITTAYRAFLMRQRPENYSLIFLSLSVAVGTYLVMVAASRAGMVPQEFDIFQAYTNGLSRFHFFWLGTLLPFTFLTLIRLLDTFAPTVRIPANIFAIGLVAFAIGSGAINHAQYFADIQSNRIQDEVGCLRDVLSKGLLDTVICPHVYPADIKSAVLFSLQEDASWIKNYQIGTLPKP